MIVAKGGSQVRRKVLARTGRVAVLAAALMLVLTGCSAHDVERDLRFGWPTGITDQGTRMRVLWTWSSVAALAVGVLVWGLIFWICLRHRKKNDDIPRQTKFNLPLEITYTVVPFIIIVVLFWRTVVTENYVDKLTANPTKDPNTVVVKVVAFKWNWEFDYESNKGQATTYDSSTTALNTVGTSTQIPILVIPKGTKVRFIEHSQDVIHAFWVPEFLFKRDVIPYGTDATTRDNQFEITATTDGSFVGRCAELCGTYHSQMNFEVRVVDPDVFNKYLEALKQLGPNDPARQAEALTQAGMSACATTTHPFNTDRSLRAPTQPGTGASDAGGCT
ncbi:MAG: cytochrome c oxidase subunit II [Actinobacteria bacterium]|nr:cytochrome c oxidase subunit II [Actinomycetota bacterium]